MDVMHKVDHPLLLVNNQHVKSRLSKFGNGDIVMLKLDLSANISKDVKSGGTLGAVIDGNSSNEMILFNNILQDGIADVGMDFTTNDGDDNDGFSPNVCGYDGTHLKFVRFDTVE